ncbi:hypothetical protein [Pseudosulfitobacter pseudonitzschiae]|nr:hypothetical protein [Pseudosulfitobacter pseudonitzschiae]
MGTAWPMQPMDRVLDEVRALPIEHDIAARWLGGNARTFLGL